MGIKRDVISAFISLLIFSIILIYSVTAASLFHGELFIQTEPIEANVTITGNFVGTTPLLYLPGTNISEPFILEISKQGYLSETREIRDMPQSGDRLHISVILSPVSEYGSISLSAVPDGAQASLDGGTFFQLPYTYPSVLVGKHTITITKTGYKKYFNDSVIIYPDKKTVISPYLIPNQQKLELVISTNPSGADILIDGIYRGKTRADSPLILGPFPDGEHLIKAHLTGYQESSMIVRTQQDRSTNVFMELVPILPKTSSFSLRIRSKPPGADVFLNGIHMGITPATGYLEYSQIPSNRYKIQLSLPGYQNYSTWLFPLPGETIIVDQILKK